MHSIVSMSFSMPMMALVFGIAVQIAGSEAVEPVAELLAHPELHEDARMALERLPGDEATAALQAALAAASEAQKPALAHSLRVRGVEVPGVPDLRLKPVKKTTVQPVGR